MKKIKKIIPFIILGILLIGGCGFWLYNFLIDENSLSINEKKWIDNNSNQVISISIPNDISIFGKEGEGVFFDFTNYLNENLGLKINNNTISYKTIGEEYHFEVTSKFYKNALLLFKDHFVLVSNNAGIIRSDVNIVDLKPAVLNEDLSLVSEYTSSPQENFVGYESYDKITEDLGNGTIGYALVSLNEFKSHIIKNGINILSHISDLNRYYYFKLGTDEVLNNILTKVFNTWVNEEFNDSYNKNNYQLFIKSLGITDVEEDSLTNKVYKYGFTENRPYEILSGGEYGGITSEYLKMFSEFSGVEFTYKKYKTSEFLAAAAIEGDIDLYYNYYNLVTNYIDAGELKEIDYYVVVNNSIDLSMSNLNGLANQTVYVLKNSYLYDLIKDIEGIEIITYDTSDELKSIIKKDSIIVLDSNTFDYYVNSLSNSYSVRLKGIEQNETYSFRYLNDTDTFYILFNAYTKTIDPGDLLRTGITTYNKVNTKGKIVTKVLIYMIVTLIILFIILFYKHRSTKKIKLDTKVKKDDRLKYVDLLTSLKNRNYYNERVNVWNKNTIYPQTAIVLDINRVKELNDAYGIQEGDKQIQAVANILIKTQIDSSEIIRTDGNEFFIYLVGYSEKQIVSYMKKLVKEFNKLPYYGVAMGFSMIEDDTKLIEDAFNEASIQMRENKMINEEKDDKKV